MRRVAIVLGVLFAMMVIAAWVKPPLLVDKANGPQNLSTQGVPAGNNANVGTDLQQRIEQLEGRSKAEADVFAAQKDELEYLTHLIEAMMSVVGIFAIFLAAASWTTLEGQRKTAEKQLADLRGRFDEDSQESLAKLNRLRDELQLDFPMLGRIQANFTSVLLNLRSACQSLVPRDDTYEGLGWKERQDILYYENAITTALLLNAQGHDKELSEIYRLLGIFYVLGSIQDWPTISFNRIPIQAISTGLTSILNAPSILTQEATWRISMLVILPSITTTHR
jgi:hypothetical protein